MTHPMLPIMCLIARVVQPLDNVAFIVWRWLSICIWVSNSPSMWPKWLTMGKSNRTIQYRERRRPIRLKSKYEPSRRATYLNCRSFVVLLSIRYVLDLSLSYIVCIVYGEYETRRSESNMSEWPTANITFRIIHTQRRHSHCDWVERDDGNNKWFGQ